MELTAKSISPSHDELGAVIDRPIADTARRHPTADAAALITPRTRLAVPTAFCRA